MKPDEVLGVLKVMVWMQLTKQGKGKHITLLTMRNVTEAMARVETLNFSECNPNLRDLDCYAQWQANPIGMTILGICLHDITG
jgi:hypothetical protein